MKPDIKTPEINNNQAPVSPAFGIEQGLPGSGPEINPGSGIERNLQSIESSPSATVTVQATVLPTPVIVVDDSSMVSTSGAPLVASDDDLIEKEWVQRAKKIVSDTKGDPCNREGQATELKVDYLQKRFGRKLGADK